ncbi:MAG: hypothetical protein IKR25_10910 [Muribaculaceae bacterium]|nr:hypothetical protein [Muribaculaceae bacterium]
MPDPEVQQPDGTQGFNRYTYCLNNPLQYVDVDGENTYIFNKNGKGYYHAYRNGYRNQ